MKARAAERKAAESGFTYKLAWSDELGRMVLIRPDGSVWDIGFGDRQNEDWFRAMENWRVTSAKYGAGEVG